MVTLIELSDQRHTPAVGTDYLSLLKDMTKNALGRLRAIWLLVNQDT